MTETTDVMEKSKHATITNGDYWGKIRRSELPESLWPRSLRDLALLIGERLYGMERVLPGHIMTTDDTDPARAHLNGYMDALQDVLQMLTDEYGEMRFPATPAPVETQEKGDQ